MTPDRPDLVFPADNQNARTGSTAILECAASGNPFVTDFFWRKDGLRLQTEFNTVKYNGGVLGSTDLTIFSVTSSDSGIYRLETCKKKLKFVLPYDSFNMMFKI